MFVVLSFVFAGVIAEDIVRHVQKEVLGNSLSIRVLFQPLQGSGYFPSFPLELCFPLVAES